MTIRPPRVMGAIVSTPVLGLAWLLFATGCGGSSFASGHGESGGSSVGDTAVTGGAPLSGGVANSTGNSDAGGTAEAGGNAATGGMAAAGGGQATGGTPETGGALTTGGVPASGGRVATGGSTAVSTTQACQQTSDCTICKYEHAVANEGDCYCATCPTTPMTRDQCDSYRNQWERYCSQVPMTCPAIACVSRLAASCSNGVCAMSTASTQ
jgi:hypothetical protein